MGIHFKLGTSASKIDGKDEKAAVELNDGTKLPADLVIMCLGIRSNIDLAKASGLAVNRGIKVNGQL